jgi:ParB family chromosome partitioning protein
MSTRKRGLGRGLDALLGVHVDQDLSRAAADGALKRLPIDLVQRGRYQPRADVKPETLQELAESIKVRGVMQPILVRPVGDGRRFEIIAGERRWRASQIAGIDEIPALVCEVSDDVAVSMALIENIQREDLNPLEEAGALHRLVTEFGLTHQQVATSIGRSRAAVSNMLRLLELEPSVKQLLETGQLEMGHARALLALGRESQREAAQQVVGRGLSVRETERLCQRLAKGSAARAHSRPQGDVNVSRLEEELSHKLGAAVQLRHGARGKGVLSIRYNSLEELDGILAHIK